MKNLVNEVDIQLKEQETRLRTSFNKTLQIESTRNSNFESKTEKKIDNIYKELCGRIESFENYHIRHNKNDTFINNNNLNEERLSEIEAKLRYKADINEIRKITDKINQLNETNNIEIKEISNIAWNAEQLCSRLTEDAFAKSDNNFQQIDEIKLKIEENSNITNNRLLIIEKKIKNQLKKTSNWMEEAQKTFK
jgi:hypothetical protein